MHQLLGLGLKGRWHRAVGFGEDATRYPMAKGLGTVGYCKAHMGPEGLVEPNQALVVVHASSLHFGKHIGVAAHSALTKNNKTAGQNVGAFHCNAYRHLLVGHAQWVGRPLANTFAAHNVHAVIDNHAGAFGDMVFGNGRDNRGLLA